MKEEAAVGESLKETALKLADELDKASEYLRCIGDADFKECANMIRRLVAELEEVTRQSSDVSSKPLPDDYVFVCKKCGDEIGIKYKEMK